MPIVVREKTCPRCGLVFRCGPGLSRDGKGCWCSDLPIVKERSGTDCLCPSCLASKVAQFAGDDAAAPVSLPLARK
ncbi:MAG: cysteine-rich CWC family protein [Acetobacteraceae bacterium]